MFSYSWGFSFSPHLLLNCIYLVFCLFVVVVWVGKQGYFLKIQINTKEFTRIVNYMPAFLTGLVYSYKCDVS